MPRQQLFLYVSSVDIVGLTEEKPCVFTKNAVTQNLQEIYPMPGSLSRNTFPNDQSSRYLQKFTQ